MNCMAWWVNFGRSREPVTSAKKTPHRFLLQCCWSHNVLFRVMTYYSYFQSDAAERALLCSRRTVWRHILNALTHHRLKNDASKLSLGTKAFNESLGAGLIDALNTHSFHMKVWNSINRKNPYINAVSFVPHTTTLPLCTETNPKTRPSNCTILKYTCYICLTIAGLIPISSL
jgi:hypothetical protein